MIIIEPRKGTIPPECEHCDTFCFPLANSIDTVVCPKVKGKHTVVCQKVKSKHWMRQIIIDEDEGDVPDTYVIPKLSENLQKCGLV